MPLIHLVIVLVVVGVILWLINSYIPMQATLKKILNVVAVIAVIIWLLSVFGVIRKLVSVWKVKNGIAEARDVALASEKQRIAMTGGVNFTNEQFIDVPFSAR